MDTLGIARRWVAMGVSVIPCKPRSKESLIRWQDYMHRLPTDQELTRWFDNRRGYNLGIVTGSVSGGLVVLDFDHGFLDLLKWQVAHKDLAQTYTVKTGRGFHVYLYTDLLPERTISAGWGDVKCSGYVLGVPSIHPSGAVYQVYKPGAIRRVSDVRAVLPRVSANADTATYGGVGGGVTDTGDAGKGTIVNVYGSGNTVNINAAPNDTHPPTLPHTWPAGALAPATTNHNGLYRGIAADIKARLPLLNLAGRYTALTPSGQDGHWYMGQCPAHDDTNASFRVDTRANLCFCWVPGCVLHDSRGQDVFDLVGKLEHCSAKVAMYRLGIELGLIKKEQKNEQ